METLLLTNLVIVFSISIVILYICQRLKVPSIVGFLISGLLAGPGCFGFVKNIHDVEMLAEIGVILLLFTIGMEFSLKQLISMKKEVLVGGGLQVALTTLISSIIAVAFDAPLNKAIFIGFLVSLSSTAIVLRLLQDKAEIDSPHGRISLGILIFQDIVIVPMILVTPLLAGTEGNLGVSLALMTAKGFGIVVLAIVCAHWVIPFILYQITKTKSHELFILSVVVICFGIAWLTYMAGLSLALGAFLAGLIISETEYSHAALGNVLPFKNVFTSFFFISLGMMLDLAFIAKNPINVALITFGLIILKTLIVSIIPIVLGYPLRTAILVGFALSQIGEFSFILAQVGIEQGLFSSDANQMLLAVAVSSMALTPVALKFAPKFGNLVCSLPIPKNLLKDVPSGIKENDPANDIDLLLIGFGLIGRTVAKASREAEIKYSIIEMNPETVRVEQEKGEPIYYGDAGNETILKHAGVKAARIVLIAINDPTATRRITERVKSINPAAHLIVRTRYVSEMQPLYALGADEVIPEEFETSVEIFARILTKFLIPTKEIDKMVHDIRSDNYEMFRELSGKKASFKDLHVHLHDISIEPLLIEQNSPFISKTLSELELPKRFKISVVAILRDENLIANPGADTIICKDDILYLMGKDDAVTKIKDI